MKKVSGSTDVLDVFLELCHALNVSHAHDPLSQTIARTVITIAAEGVCDAQELYEQTLRTLRPMH